MVRIKRRLGTRYTPQSIQEISAENLVELRIRKMPERLYATRAMQLGGSLWSLVR